MVDDEFMVKFIDDEVLDDGHDGDDFEGLMVMVNSWLVRG